MDHNAASNTKSAEDVAKAYSSPPWWYDARGFLILTFAYRSTLWSQVRFFGENISCEHLEVAIGTGTLFDMVLKWRKWKRRPSGRVIAIDCADQMLAGARKRFTGNPNIKLEHCDVAALPFPDSVFGSANIANAVHCFPDVDAGLHEVFRVLKPGGSLAANVLLFPGGPRPMRAIADSINTWGIHKGILHSPYDAGDIRHRLMSQGFSIIHDEVIGNTYNVVAGKPTIRPAAQ